ncbi:hypothetical protein [Micromonospora tulbaghiae]|uniref:hypothetical protein n=1 Tax=Micromonospora TaxID=1873 RepID=UPI00197BD12D|nr:hypothetical protein [Micromonospora tulbaghiae]
MGGEVADASAGVAGEVVSGRESVKVAAGGDEKLRAEEITNANHAGDHRGVVVAVRSVSDVLVQLGELPVEVDHVVGKSADDSPAISSPGTCVCSGGLPRCCGQLVRVADRAFAE